MKTLVFVAALLCFSMVVHAECVTTHLAVMWFDLDLFRELIRIYPSPEETVAIMALAVSKGVAIEVPAGTRLDEVKRLSATESLVRVGNVSTVVYTPRIRCQ